MSGNDYSKPLVTSCSNVMSRENTREYLNELFKPSNFMLLRRMQIINNIIDSKQLDFRLEDFVNIEPVKKEEIITMAPTQST